MVGIDEDDASDLKPIKSVSSSTPIFGPELLETLRWAASYYVAPVAAMLPRAGPPNLPRGSRTTPAPRHDHGRASYIVTSQDDYVQAREVLSRAVSEGHSGLAILPTAHEVATFSGILREAIGDKVVEVPPSGEARAVTDAWNRSCLRTGTVAVGSHRLAFWPVCGLGTAVVVEEGRRSMKDRQTPTVHAREILRRRALVERFNLVYVGGVPSTQLLASGVEVRMKGARGWPPVEIVDRSEDPPGTGIISEHTRKAIRGVLARGGRVFAFSHRHGYAPALRCVSCKTLRRCRSCGSRPDPGETCSRCGATLGPCEACGGVSFEPLGAGVGRVTEVMRRLFGESVGPVGEDASIWVGTERDIPMLSEVTLGVIIDMDGLIFGSAYNAGEEALRIGARLARAIPFGRGRRLIIQTNLPDHPVIAALRSGDPLSYLGGELERRREYGLPPAGEVIVLEVGGGCRDPLPLLEPLSQTATIYGPAARDDTLRWLIQGRDLTATKLALRGVVSSLREGGCAVRVDVDPLDL